MLNIVLFEPEIAENTGNIIRTCVGFNGVLHLIRPYGFFFSKQLLKRSSANHFDDANIIQHDCWDDFLSYIEKYNDKDIYYFTRYGTKNPNTLDMKNKNVFIVFGKESTGIDKEILKNNKERCIRIPMSNKLRSMNISNCVAMISYEYVKQNDFSGLETKELFKPLW